MSERRTYGGTGKPRDMSGPQAITRIPKYRPGTWIKVGPDVQNGTSDLSGKVLRVTALTCSMVGPAAVWRIHLGGGRSLEVRFVERLATDEEIELALRRANI